MCDTCLIRCSPQTYIFICFVTKMRMYNYKISNLEVTNSFHPRATNVQGRYCCWQKQSAVDCGLWIRNKDCVDVDQMDRAG